MGLVASLLGPPYMLTYNLSPLTCLSMGNGQIGNDLLSAAVGRERRVEIIAYLPIAH